MRFSNVARESTNCRTCVNEKNTNIIPNIPKKNARLDISKRASFDLQSKVLNALTRRF